MRIFLFIFFLFALNEVKANSANKLMNLSDKKEVIMIEPMNRAQDFLQAYEVIKKGKSPTSVIFILNDGSQITNVMEMSLMEHGTLILLKVGTALGHQFTLVPVESLKTIAQL